MKKSNNYFKNFKNPRWQKKRLEILERDEWKCSVCDDKESTLVVHHFWYGNIKDDTSGKLRRRLPWEYDNKDLTTLCEECHQEEHELRQDSEADLLQILKQQHFRYEDISSLSQCVINIGDDISPQDALDGIYWILKDKKTLNSVKTFLGKPI